MRNERWLVVALGGALALVVVLLVVMMMQLHNLEARFITQGQQLRALGEATDRLSASGLRGPGTQTASAGHDPGRAEYVPPPGVKFLHPELPNYFVPRDTHWPVAGANLDGVFVRGFWAGDPKGWNPLLENGAYNIEFVETYVGLFLGDRNSWTDPDKFHGEAAYRLEITDDFKEFTFYLRQDLTWHQPAGVNLDDPKLAWLKGPHPMTAEDFVFTLDMVMHPAVESGPLKNYYGELESWTAPDPYTFVLRWKKKQYTNVSFSIQQFALPKFLYAHERDGRPVPKETLGLRFNQHWYNNKGLVGAGPYRMASYVPGSKIVLERYEAFPGPKPALKQLVYPIYTDVNQTLLRLKARELNYGELQAGQYREEVLKYEGVANKPKSPFLDGSIECRPTTESSYRYIGWNADRPLFSDKRVRRAMTHAFDRKRIIQSVYAGLGDLTTHPYIHGSPFADPSIAPIPFDLAAAKKLLGEAGFTDTDGDGLLDGVLPKGDGKRVPFEFTLLVATARKETQVAADILRDDLLKIGVKMNVEAVEWSLFLKRMDEKAFDAFFGAWMLLWEPDLYQVWHSSQADLPKGSNRVGFRNKEADRIIEALRVSFDKAERTRLLHAFHRLVDDEQPYTFFMNPKIVYCAANELKNVTLSHVFPRSNVFPWWSTRTAP